MKFLTKIFTSKVAPSEWQKTLSAIDKGDIDSALKLVADNLYQGENINSKYMNSFSNTDSRLRMKFLEMLASQQNNNCYEYMMEFLLATSSTNAESRPGDKFYHMARSSNDLGERSFKLLISIQNPKYIIKMLNSPRVIGAFARNELVVDLLEHIRLMKPEIKEEVIKACNLSFIVDARIPSISDILNGLETPVTESMIAESVKKSEAILDKSSTSWQEQLAKFGLPKDASGADLIKAERALEGAVRNAIQRKMILDAQEGALTLK